MRVRAGRLAAFACLALAAAAVRAETPLPAVPQRHFNDYAGVVSPADAARLDARLAEFEAQTSTQLLVAVFPSLPSPSLEDFTVRTAHAWGIGGRQADNGVVFFVFVADRKMRIEAGYGLEGALPDQLAGRILDEQVRPRFRSGDFAGGLEAGIEAILAATRGEYRAVAGTGGTGAHRRSSGLAIVVLVVFVVLFLWLTSLAPRGRTYGSHGWRREGSWGGGGWDGWSSGGGFGGDGGGGGFSAGGGGFGGGGASSDW